MTEKAPQPSNFYSCQTGRAFSLLFYSFLAGILFWGNLFSQEPEENNFPSPQIKQFKHSIKAGAGLPLILSNNPFRKTMDGVFSVSGSADFLVYKNFTAGLNYGYEMFDNAELKGNKGRRPDVTKGFISSPGTGIGYEYFFNDNKMLFFSATGGYSKIKFIRAVSFTDSVSNLFHSEGFHLGFSTGYSIIIEETGGIGFYLSYKYFDYVFDPKKISFIYEPENNKNQTLTFGILFILGY